MEFCKIARYYSKKRASEVLVFKRRLCAILGVFDSEISK